jgi:hypothetical protein
MNHEVTMDTLLELKQQAIDNDVYGKMPDKIQLQLENVGLNYNTCFCYRDGLQYCFYILDIENNPNDDSMELVVCNVLIPTLKLTVHVDRLEEKIVSVATFDQVIISVNELRDKFIFNSKLKTVYRTTLVSKGIISESTIDSQE